MVANLSRVAKDLERIADSLEALVKRQYVLLSGRIDYERKPPEAGKLHQFDLEKLWELEQDELRVRAQGRMVTNESLHPDEELIASEKEESDASSRIE